jgi:hypothetical protein
MAYAGFWLRVVAAIIDGVIVEVGVTAIGLGIGKVPDSARTRDAKGGQCHGDAAIALALGHYASRQESISYEYHRVAPRERDDDQLSRPVRTGNAGFGLQRGCGRFQCWTNRALAPA